VMVIKKKFEKMENVEYIFANRKYQQEDGLDPITYDCISWTPVTIEMPKEKSKKPLKEINAENDSEETSEHRRKSFAKIYADGEWGSESKSGPGSLLGATVRMREILGVVVDKIKDHLNVQNISILDSSCGDMTWMPTFITGRNDVMFTGFDIVPQNIENHRKNFTNWIFKVHDIVSEPILASYDLIISRHTTIHLKNGDVIKVVRNFINSGSKYLITTNFPNITENEDVREDDLWRYRPLNLMLSPFHLPKPLCITKDTDPDYIGLWDLRELEKI